MKGVVCWSAVVPLLMMSPASAQMESMNVAMELGSVLAAEKPCGLTFDQAAIEAYIQKNVKASDMSFMSSLSMMTRGQAARFKDMSESEKTAFCAQARRVARANKFIN